VLEGVRLPATSHKPQATSHKPQATSHKLQASSFKLQAASFKLEARSKPRRLAVVAAFGLACRLKLEACSSAAAAAVALAACGWLGYNQQPVSHHFGYP